MSRNNYMRLIEDFVSEDLISGEGLPKIDSNSPQRLKTGMPKPEPKIYKRTDKGAEGGDTNVNVSMGGAGAGIGGEPGEVPEPEIEITEPEGGETEPESDLGDETGGDAGAEGSEEEEEEPQ